MLRNLLENAPYLIVIFKQIYQVDESGNRTNVYFPDKSVGIATGMLIALLTDLGIDILTYTPSPNLFLKDILKRPDNERPYLVLVCGKGSKTYKLPNITKKSNDKVMKIYWYFNYYIKKWIINIEFQKIKCYNFIDAFNYGL